MKKEEEEKYLDQWGTKCLLCEQEVERKNMRLVGAIVPLDNLPDHAESPVTKFYMVCTTCLAGGSLV